MIVSGSRLRLFTLMKGVGVIHHHINVGTGVPPAGKRGMVQARFIPPAAESEALLDDLVPPYRERFEGVVTGARFGCDLAGAEGVVQAAYAEDPPSGCPRPQRRDTLNGHRSGELLKPGTPVPVEVCERPLVQDSTVGPDVQLCWVSSANRNPVSSERVPGHGIRLKIAGLNPTLMGGMHRWAQSGIPLEVLVRHIDPVEVRTRMTDVKLRVHALQGVDSHCVGPNLAYRHEIYVALMGLDVPECDGANQVESLDETGCLGVDDPQVSVDQVRNRGIQGQQALSTVLGAVQDVNISSLVRIT